MLSAYLDQIAIYPIKSSAGIELSSSWVDKIGLPFDRRFVVSDTNGQFITARTMPKLCLIQANLTPSGLILTAPDMPLLAVNYDKCLTQYQEVTVWKDTLMAQRCAQEVDLWFSQYVGKACQLLYFGEQSSRFVSKTNNPVAFADGYPLLLISRASLTELNSRLEQPVVMANFRPNLIVENCEPFAEDTWQHIRIGEVEFEVTKPCSRCIFTTVNPLTGEKHPQQEPLATLKSYRQVASGDVMFGQNLIPLNKGRIKQGDTVNILRSQPSPIFISKKVTSKQPSQANVSAEPSTLVCIKIIDETHDVKTFSFERTTQTSTEKREKFSYHAGQHLPFKVTIEGKAVNAIYTLSSSPTRPDLATITIKRVVGGKVSNFMHDHFKVGDTILAKPPAGKFHLDNIDSSKVLLLSAGSGITPMLSMLKAMTDIGSTNDVVFFHSARSEQDLIAFDEVTALAKQHGLCKVSYTLTQNASPQWQAYQGHLSEQMLTNIPQLIERQVMVCGPEGFREQAKSLLITLGLPEHQFHFESFGKRRAAQEDIASSVVEEPEAKNIPAKVNILFDSWDKHVVGNTKETVLEQGEAAGLILPYSCRGGMCGSCKVKLENGEVKELANDGLMAGEREQGYILACSCIPQSDIVITQG